MNRKISEKRLFALLTFIIILVSFSSCISYRRTSEDGSGFYAYLTNNSRFTLLPPSAIATPLDMAQFVCASFGGQEYFFNAWVYADAAGMEMHLMNELGTNIGTLTFTAEQISFSSQIFPDSVQPEYIVADFQLCFYDPVLLARELEKCGLTLEITETAAGTQVRRVFYRKDAIIEIYKTPNSVDLTNNLRGYSYTLEGDFL